MKKYFWDILIAIDRLANAILGGNSRETISSRLAKLRNRGNTIGEVGCDILDTIDENHCDDSIEEI